MKDKSLIYLGTVLIYCAELLRGVNKNKQELRNIALDDAVMIFGGLPFGVVDGRKWFEQAKENIRGRRSNAEDLLKDID